MCNLDCFHILLLFLLTSHERTMAQVGLLDAHSLITKLEPFQHDFDF